MWKLQSLGACVSFTAMLLILKRTSNSGLSPTQIIGWVSFVGSAFFLIQLISTSELTLLSRWSFLPLIGAGMFSYIGNYLLMKALADSPNPGYAVAIVNLNSLLLVITTAIILRTKITIIKVIGTIFCVIGASLLLF